MPRAEASDLARGSGEHGGRGPGAMSGMLARVGRGETVSGIGEQLANFELPGLGDIFGR